MLTKKLTRQAYSPARRACRRLAVLAAFVLVLAVNSINAPLPADAAGRNVGTNSGLSYYCDYGNSDMGCLFYDADQQGAYWGKLGSPCYWPNFYNQTFYAFDPPGSADGQGAPVWNNAASIANNVRFPMYIFYNQNYTGNYDWLPAYTYGNSSAYTLNNNASGYVYC